MIFVYTDECHYVVITDEYDLIRYDKQWGDSILVSFKSDNPYRDHMMLHSTTVAEWYDAYFFMELCI